MEFSDWITQKYIDWRGDAIGQERSITKFAELLGVPQSLMTQWLKKGGKTPTSQKYISALISHFGAEVYEILGISRPSEDDLLSELPPEMAEDVRSFLAEVRSSEINKGKTEASPEDLEKIKQMFSKHLGKYTSTEQ